MAAMADMGLSPATILFVSRHRAASSHKDVQRIAKASFALYLLLASVLVALFIFTAPSFLLLMGVSHPQFEGLSRGLPFLAVTLASQFVSLVPYSIIRGYERYDLDALIQTVTSLIAIIAICSVVYFGGDIPEMLILQAIVFVTSLCLALFISVRLIGNRTWLIPYCSLESFKEFFSVSIYGWFLALSGILFSQADRLLVSAILGPAALGFYGAALQISQTAHGLIARSLGFLFPKFSTLQSDQAAMLRLFNRAMLATTVLGSVSAITLFFASPTVLRVWLGHSIPSDLPTTLSLLAVVNGFMATTIAPGALAFGAGLFRLSAISSLLSGLLVSSSALVLIPTYGIVGAVVAKFAFLPVSTASRVVVFHRAFGSWNWSLGVRQLMPVASALAPSIILTALWSAIDNSAIFWPWALLAAVFGLLLMWAQCRHLYGSL
jgi:O-antigen/teichoic acid export membrane protein